MSCHVSVGRSAGQNFPVQRKKFMTRIWKMDANSFRGGHRVLVIWQTTSYGDQMFVLVSNRYQFVSHMRLFSAFSRRSVLSIIMELAGGKEIPEKDRAYGFKFSSVRREECFGFWWQQRGGCLYLWNENFWGNMSIINLHPSSMAWMKAACIVLCKLTCQLLQFVENTYFY